MKQDTKVDIFGNTYVIRAEVDEAYTQSLAEFVDQRMREVARGTATVSSLKIAILTALTIADDLFRLRAEMTEGSKVLDHKTQEILDLLQEEY